MIAATSETISSLLDGLGSKINSAQPQGLAVTAPATGAVIARLKEDSASTLEQKIGAAKQAQKSWATEPRHARAKLVDAFSAVLKNHREALAELIVLEAGKTMKEALGEVDSSADVLAKTIRDASLPELNGMLRTKERPPVGVVGLITSFNFPLVVACWSLAPALLAGNAVVWKPSEKTPLVALACKALFDAVAGDKSDLLQILIGGREMGSGLVSHEAVDMISATGSVAMGQGIKATLSRKKNNAVRPILELGGNNGVIISDKMSKAHLEWSLKAIMNSFLGTTGQRCTNTRRLIIHQSQLADAVSILKKILGDFIASNVIKSPLSGESNEFGYGPLIDEDAYRRYEHAVKKIAEAGGELYFGKRILTDEYPEAYYIEPAIAVLPSHAPIMEEETFAPLLLIAPYADFEQALKLVNRPDNAGLVNGIYTQSQAEADRFAAENKAGHGLINSAKGTGTPAHGMGFGGNKASGEGEILNSADPLQAFTRGDSFTRIAQNKDIEMNF